MARTEEGGLLTVAHRQGQATVRARALREHTRLWPLWNGDEASFRRLVAATVPLIQVNHRLSSLLASAYYEAFRRAERAGGSARTRLAADPNVERIIASLYVTGAVMTRKALAAGQSPDAAMQTALVRTSGAVTRHVLAGSRATLTTSSLEDPAARGWERVTSGRPCDFCARLAGEPAQENSTDFPAHDHCLCTVQPAYV